MRKNQQKHDNPTNKQKNKRAKKQMAETEYAKSKRVYVLYSFNLRQRKTFDEVSGCVWNNFENSETFAKDFIQLRCYIIWIYVYFGVSTFSLKDDWKVLQRYSCPK